MSKEFVNSFEVKGLHERENGHWATFSDLSGQEFTLRVPESISSCLEIGKVVGLYLEV
ncbi:MAG: hypothetical protein ACE5QW_04635 [Thermoplasmata archaeon]